MTRSNEEITAELTAPGARFEVAEAIIRGIPTRIWKNAPPSLRAVLARSRAYGDQTFLVYEDEQLSFETHFRTAAHLANRLVDDWGVRKGDRIAIAMRNFPEWSLAFWAVTTAGAIAVPLNAWWTGEELAYGITDSGSRIVFADAQRAERLAPHLQTHALDHAVVARAGNDAPAGDDARAGDDTPTGYDTPTGDDGPTRWSRFESLVANVPGEVSLPAVDLEPEDDATIFYTSGTTGKPKGARGTHRNICGNLMSVAFAQARAAARAGASTAPPANRPHNALLLSVPFFHATGCHAILVSNTAFGGKLVMMYKWDAERALELIERERLTSFGGVPAMVWQVLESPSFATRDLSSVRSVSYGGAPAAPELVRRIKEAFPGGTPSNGYGLTETSSVTTLNVGLDYIRKPDSVGLPMPVCDVRIVRSDGSDAPRGKVGELWIKGPNVVRGYWDNPEATAETFTDGWLHSGDLARIDDEGFVYIVDRAKDMVIRSGENIYCVEVESVLYDHPDVMDAAVVGLPHKILGEEVGAVVQARAGTALTTDALRKHVAVHLAGFKVPVRIDIRQEPLPRNANGKLLKQQLRDEMMGGARGSSKRR